MNTPLKLNRHCAGGYSYGAAVDPQTGDEHAAFTVVKVERDADGMCYPSPRWVVRDQRDIDNVTEVGAYSLAYKKDTVGRLVAMIPTHADRVDPIRRRLTAATPGPWMPHFYTVCSPSEGMLAQCTSPTNDHQNAELIAKAPADIDWLLTELTAAAAREEMLIADLESTRANLEVTTRRLDESEEARAAAIAANAARRERTLR